jgi:hypothetical protein
MVSGVTWSVRPLSIGARITKQVDSTRDELEDMVRGVVKDGADNMRRFILEAVTKTGEARAAAGEGVAGRYETGTMYDAVGSDVQRSGDRITGEFGWLEEVLKYYLYQEQGTSRIDAMHALQKAWINASEEFQAQVNDILRRNF